MTARSMFQRLNAASLRYCVLSGITLFFVSACSFQPAPTPSYEIDYSDDIVFDSNDAEARFLYLKSELLLKREMFEEALATLEEANDKLSKPSPTIVKRLAQLSIRKGDLARALEYADTLIEINPDSIDALQLKAGTLGAMGDIDGAISVYHKIFAQMEEPEEEPYLLLSGLLIQQGRQEEAGSVLRELLQKKSDSFVGTYYLAKLYFTLGDNLSAIKYYEKALEINPSADQVALELIQVLAVDRQIQKAIERCQKLIRQSPGNGKAKSFLAELLLGDQKIEEALKAFEEAKQTDENPSELQFKVALIKLQRKDYDGAEAELNLLLHNNPTYHQARYYLATAYASLDRIDEAVQQLSMIPPQERLYKKSIGFSSFLLRSKGNYGKAISILDESLIHFPSDTELLGYKVVVLKDSGDLPGTIALLEKIKELEPDDEHHLFNLGVAYDESGEKGKALEIMEEVIEKNPLHANALNYLGYSLAESNKDLARAEELVKRAIKLEENNGYFIDSLGWIYYQSGKYKEALRYLERANELVNSDPVIMEHLGKTYLKLGKGEKARRILEQAFDLLKDDEKEKDLRLEIQEILKNLGGK
jgi:tetratricopeptide (TPR) repeat protein